VLEDIGAGGAGCENCGYRWEGQACSGAERLVRVLLDGAGRGGRFEAERSYDRLQSADFAGGAVDYLERRLV